MADCSRHSCIHCAYLFFLQAFLLRRFKVHDFALIKPWQKNRISASMGRLFDYHLLLAFKNTTTISTINRTITISRVPKLYSISFPVTPSIFSQPSSFIR
jgi:hypothetical protein